MSAPRDYRTLLAKYVALVLHAEGVTYVDWACSERDFTPDEVFALEAAEHEALSGTPYPPSAAPIYGVEVTYMSGRVEVMNITDALDWAEMFRRMLATAVGRAHATDGIAKVRLVSAIPAWAPCEEGS